MSKLIAKAATLAAVWLLAACVELPIQVSRDEGGNGASNTKVVSVSGQELTIGGAAGYCIDKRQSRYTRDGAFVVMAPCEDAEEVIPAKGLVLVNVLSSQALQDAITEDALDDFFRSEEGRRALSAKSDPQDVEILGTMESDGAYVVHTRDKSGPIIPDTSDEQWRMFMVVRDRLVSISVINFTDAPMSDGQIFTQMETIATRIRDLNG